MYGWFNLPLVLTPFTLYNNTIYTLSAILAVNVFVHILYWYIISCGLKMPFETKKEYRYKYAFFVVLYFIVLAILMMPLLSIARF